MNDIIKIVQALEDFNILLKRVTKTIKNETKEKKKEGFLVMLLGTLWDSLLGNMLAEKNCKSRLWKQKWKRNVKTGYGNKMDFKYRLIL